jgi:hypothetical protein
MMARLGILIGFLLIMVSGVALATLVVLPMVETYRNQPTLMQIQAVINCPAGQTFEQQFSATNTQLGGLLPVVTSSCVNATGRATILNEGQETRRGIISAAAVLVPLLVGLSLMVSGRASLNQRALRAAAQTTSTAPSSTVKVWTVNAAAANPGSVAVAPKAPAPGALVITTASELRPQPSEPVLLTKPALAPAPVVEPIIEKANAVVEAVADTRSSPVTPPVPMPAVPSPTAAMVSSTSSSPASLAQRLQQLEEAFDKNLINTEEFNRLRTALLNEVTRNLT